MRYSAAWCGVVVEGVFSLQFEISLSPVRAEVRWPWRGRGCGWCKRRLVVHQFFKVVSPLLKLSCGRSFSKGDSYPIDARKNLSGWRRVAHRGPNPSGIESEGPQGQIDYVHRGLVTADQLKDCHSCLAWFWYLGVQGGQPTEKRKGLPRIPP